MPSDKASPVFHIVTPAYNAAALISETAMSVLSQAGAFRLRYHVQDGGSDDDTAALLEDIAALVERGGPFQACEDVAFSFETASDNGMYDAIARGFAHLAPDPGEADHFMCWINAGDRIWPGALQAVAVMSAQLGAQVDWLIGQFMTLNENGVVQKVYPRLEFTQAGVRAGLHDGRIMPFVPQEASVWRARLWHACGGIRPDLKLAGDFDLWRRMAAHAAPVGLDLPIGAFRFHEGQLSGDGDRYVGECDSTMTAAEHAARDDALREFLEIVHHGGHLRDAPGWWVMHARSADRSGTVWHLMRSRPKLAHRRPVFRQDGLSGRTLDAGVTWAPAVHDFKRFDIGEPDPQYKAAFSFREPCALILRTAEGGDYALDFAIEHAGPRIAIAVSVNDGPARLAILPGTGDIRILRVSARLVAGDNRLALEGAPLPFDWSIDCLTDPPRVSLKLRGITGHRVQPSGPQPVFEALLDTPEGQAELGALVHQFLLGNRGSTHLRQLVDMALALAEAFPEHEHIRDIAKHWAVRGRRMPDYVRRVGMADTSETARIDALERLAKAMAPFGRLSDALLIVLSAIQQARPGRIAWSVMACYALSSLGCPTLLRSEIANLRKEAEGSPLDDGFQVALQNYEGRLAALEGRFEEAAASFLDAASMAPEFFELRIMAMRMHLLMGREMAAIAQLKDMFHHAPHQLERLEPRFWERILTVSGQGTAQKPLRHIPRSLPDGKPWPRISIVTPSYNQGEFIEETIRSVIDQAYPNLQYILVDGGSTDTTGESLERFRDRIDVLVIEPDEGQSDALNKGFALADGDILAWLNSDDRLLPGALFSVALAFARSNADMVAGAVEVERNGRPELVHLTCHESGPLALERLLDVENEWLSGTFFFQPEVFFTRDLWQRAGGRVNTDLYYSMDYDLWVRMAHAGATLCVIGAPLVIYRMHDAQKTSTVDTYVEELRATTAAWRARLGFGSAPQEVKAPKRPGRICLVNDIGYKFGAGHAQGTLARALAARGSEPAVLALGDGVETPEKADRRLIDRLDELSPDLVIFGNLHAAGAAAGIEALAHSVARFPTIFFAHDEWIFTGRCAYRQGCDKYLTLCDSSCPTADQFPKLAPERIADAYAGKRAALEGADGARIIGNSRSMAQLTLETFGLDPAQARFRWWRYNVDLDVFRPLDKERCRALFGLEPDAFIVLSMAVDFTEPRKGADLLLDAFTGLDIARKRLVLIGAEKTQAASSDVTGIGYLTDRRLLAALYNCADLFVVPSREEAFGQTAIEAAACGVPTVAFAVGGLTSSVADGVSGVLVDEVSPAALGAALADLAGDRERLADLGFFARIFVESEFSHRSTMYDIFQSVRALWPDRHRRIIGSKVEFPANARGRPDPEVLTRIDASGGAAPAGGAQWPG